MGDASQRSEDSGYYKCGPLKCVGPSQGEGEKDTEDEWGKLRKDGFLLARGGLF